MEAWYFSTDDRKLQYGDDRPIIAGETHKVEGDLKICSNGLHASVNIFDAMFYAPGNILWRVEVSGEILDDDNKLCARQRKYLWGFDATEVLLEFARSCALDVIHQWDAPDVVVEYLKTGNESLRLEACAAAAAYAASAAYAAAAYVGVNAAYAAYAAAAYVGVNAAYAAYATADAAYAADVNPKAQEKKLLEMIEKARKA